MAAQSNVTLNTKVYAPRGNVGGIATWKLQGDSTFGGAVSTLTQSLGEPSKEGVQRARIRLLIPKAATADSTCACVGTVLSTGTFDGTFIIPSNFTAAERADFCARVKDAFADAITTALVGSLEPAW